MRATLSSFPVLNFQNEASDLISGQNFLDDVRISTGACDVQLFECDFEGDGSSGRRDLFCGGNLKSVVENLEDTSKVGWTENSASGFPDRTTRSSSGHYLTLESSKTSKSETSENVSESTIFSSQDLLSFYGVSNVHQTYCFSFWRYMFGKQAKKLSLEIYANEKLVFRISGNQGRHWIRSEVNIENPGAGAADELHIIVKGKLDEDVENSSLAIDDVSLLVGKCMM